MKDNFELIGLTLWSRILGLFLALMIIILNSIEFHVLRLSKTKPYYEKMLLSLTCCDLITGVLSLIGTAFDPLIESKSEFYHILCWTIWGYGVSYSALCSLLHLMIISLDRLLAVYAPLKHRQHSVKKKLIATVAFSWGMPMIFVSAYIILNLTRKLKVKEIYSYIQTNVFSTVAKFTLIADAVFIFSYSCIIWIMITRKSKALDNRPIQQKRLMNTITICLGIVMVSIVLTTPFVVVYVTDWKRPHELIKSCMFLFSLNQICNSLVYLIQKFRNRRTPSARNSVISVATRNSVGSINEESAL